MKASDARTTKRAVNLTLDAELLARARAQGLNLSAIAEAAIATAVARNAREKLEADIAQACRVHEQYLAEYGSLADAVRTSSDATG